MPVDVIFKTLPPFEKMFPFFDIVPAWYKKSFLVKLINFKPNDIYSMKIEQKNTKLTSKQISEWDKLISTNVKKIWKFKLSVKGGDLAKQGLKGKDIQDKMNELEMNESQMSSV